MQIEIVDFFPKKVDRDNQFLRGHLHIYLIDIQMDLRGVCVSRDKEKWRFFLPSGIGKDHETGNEVRYLIASFTASGVNKSIVDWLRQNGPEYIKKNHPEYL